VLASVLFAGFLEAGLEAATCVVGGGVGGLVLSLLFANRVLGLGVLTGVRVTSAFCNTKIMWMISSCGMRSSRG
jgi:hypothetical protein